MDQPESQPPNLQLFTIGHSNQEQTSFLDLLKQHGIEVLVDVRSQPYSKYTTQFNAAEIKPAVIAAGLKYLYLGKELGGRPQGDEFYDSSRRVIYTKIAHSPLFLAGVERLLTGLSKYRVAVMCTEENPTGCHRRLLVGRVLDERGVLVTHIRGDGSLQTEATLRTETQPTQQMSLFEDEDDLSQWKSIHSVSPKKVRPGSLIFNSHIRQNPSNILEHH